MSGSVPIPRAASAVPARAAPGVLPLWKTVAMVFSLTVLLLSAVALRMWIAVQAVNVW
jgi:hypothetical protein